MVQGIQWTEAEYALIAEWEKEKAKNFDLPFPAALTLRLFLHKDLSEQGIASCDVFDTFKTPTAGHRAMLASAKRFVNLSVGPDGQWVPRIYMRGIRGVGKTHLAQACLYDLLQRNQKVLYWTVGQFWARIKHTFGQHDSPEDQYTLSKQAGLADVLIFDDLRMDEKQWQKEILFRVLDMRVKMPTFITGVARPDEFETMFGEDSASRLLDYEMHDISKNVQPWRGR